MQNSPYPFGQKEHVFDFKVKVNFQNGNVSLTAPEIVTPPGRFINQSPMNHNNPNQQVYSQPVYNGPLPHNTTQIQNMYSPYAMQQNNINPQIVQSQISYQPLTKPKNLQQKSPYPTQSISNVNQCQSSHLSNQYQTPAQYPPQPISSIPQNPTQNRPLNLNNNSSIEMVNSSYTSFKQQQLPIMNMSTEYIECVLCQKSFHMTEFDQHLELHRNKSLNRNTPGELSNQKNNVSNFAKTQNSFNGNNDSSISEGSSISQQSFHNQSYQSLKSNKNNNHNKSASKGSITLKQPSRGSINHNQSLSNNLNQAPVTQNQSLNESSHLLGRIQNPILALNMNQNSMSQSYSSQHQNNSLNYSNSNNQSTTRFKDPNQLHSIGSMNAQLQNSPQFEQVHQNSHSSSFGNHQGSNVIGPSFFQNSSLQSGNPQLVNPFSKGINRLAYHQNQNSLSHTPVQPAQQFPLNQVPLNNGSFHGMSHNSQQNMSNSSSSISYQSRNGQVMMGNNSHSFSNSNNMSNHSCQSYHSSQNSPYIQGPRHASNPMIYQNPQQFPSQMMQNFQTIQSRYLHQQPPSSTNQSQQRLYNSQQSIHQNNSYSEVPFYQNDLSSISGRSRADVSDYSDWSEFNPVSQPKLDGYNSADNSLIKQMQQQQKQSRQQQRNNIYLERSQTPKNKTEEGFFKKKKDYSINNASSYYERKFKDEDYQSSSDQEQNNPHKRLSYVERLKQKRLTDSRRPMDMTASRNLTKSNNLKQSARSNKSNNMSKCSQDSSMSKTKIPVNYLAREEFISTSSTSKSTHKTSLPTN